MGVVQNLCNQTQINFFIVHYLHTRIFFCTRDLRQGVVCLDKLVQYIIGQKYLFE